MLLYYNPGENGRTDMEDRRRLANGKEIWVIKAGFPNNERKKNWSDYIFACTLKKYLDRAGIYTIVESRDEWENSKEADVVIALRGPEAYYPDRSNPDTIYIMWNLSHPDWIKREEYNAYDLVCVGSAKQDYIEKLQRELDVPVRQLLICADMELFHPCEQEEKKIYDWVFVGNSRGIKRKSVMWSLKYEIPLKIWGKGWNYILTDNQDALVAENIPNDKLPELYWKTKVTLNDHYDDMVSNGFLNTRILEALACGVPVISDYVDVFKILFGETVLFYENEDEFLKQTKYVQENYEEISEKIQKFWSVLKNSYSFQSRVEQLQEFCQDLKTEAKETFSKFYKEYQAFMQNVDTMTYAEWKEQKENISKAFDQMTWMEQNMAEYLTEEEKKKFETFFPGVEKRIIQKCSQKKQRELQDKLNKVQEAVENLEEQNNQLEERNQFLEEWKDRLVGERTQLKEKLQQTYDEKSEINRKLQITYKEKYDRGIEIKNLNQKIESIRNSKTYRLARIIGFPVRLFRKMIRKK